jgi:hypothetical protein
MIDTFACIGIVSVGVIAFFVMIKVLDWFEDRKPF